MPDQINHTTTACSILEDAAATIGERADQRDALEERSMLRCVNAFNGLTRLNLSEEDGWIFMVCLKMARAKNGRSFHRDDYLDGAAYIALAGECVSKSNTPIPQCPDSNCDVMDCPHWQNACCDCDAVPANPTQPTA